MEALIPAPADCEVRSNDKVFECPEHSADPMSSTVPRVWPHTARRSIHFLQAFSSEVFNHHSPYSPDLSPSDFHVFLHLKKFLSVQHQRFQNDSDMKAEMAVTLVPIPGDKLLRYRIQKLIPRSDKCLISRGEYVEKYLNTCCICSNKSFY